VTTTLTHRLDRTIVIGAPPAAVFKFFTDSARWAAWWGAGSAIDARPGGRVFIRYPGGNEASGEVLEIVPPSRLVFTYGYNSGKPIAPGESRVTIELDTIAQGTRLRLTHALADAAVRDEHVQGWRYQLSVFANVVADEIHGGAAGVVDAWFDAWNETDASARASKFGAIASPGVRLHDRFSCVDGTSELTVHVGAAQRFMPGFRLQRNGDPRQCQGVVLAEWTAAGPDGQVRAQGTNVFALGADGLIESVTGFWR
jgi:uncharacterized protein YndB with AHSA1/START domain